MWSCKRELDEIKENVLNVEQDNLGIFAEKFNWEKL